MGYDIWVADDPELAAINAALDAGDEDGANEVESSGYPGFSCSNHAMIDLLDEMAARRMLEGRVVVGGKRRQLIKSWRFAGNDGIRVPPGEILASLSRADGPPLTLTDSESRRLWRKWVKFLRVAAEEYGGIVVN